jgi:hypothetical protein
MRVRWSVALLLVAGPAAADTFGGFSAIDKPYLANQDRVCVPIAVAADGTARGMPSCEKQPADAVAALRVMPAVEQKGSKASFVATAEGTTIKVMRKDAEAPVVTWEAPDPVTKIVAVYASQYEDRIAVAYTVRRLGREVTDVVAFVLVKTTGRDAGSTATGSASGAGSGSGSVTVATKDDPAVAKAVNAAVDAARKTGKAKAVAAWRDVLKIDPEHAEALFKVAQAQALGRANADAVATLAELAKSSRADAIEWLVEARFDPAFAPVRADPKYRASVGLDRKARTVYERVMGFGGQWEQTGTSCEKAQVDLTFLRERSFKLRVRSSCEGMAQDIPFKGTWRVDGDQLILSLVSKGQKASAKDEAPCKLEPAGDEDALHCALGHDLEFTALPARR